MATQAESEFHREMVEGVDRLKREIGYNPVRFSQMVAESGAPEVARQLLKGRDASDGFTTLWEASRLDMSLEAAVLLPWYEPLFTSAQRSIARRRLTEHGFDVEGFLAARTAMAPSWTQRA